MRCERLLLRRPFSLTNLITDPQVFVQRGVPPPLERLRVCRLRFLRRVLLYDPPQLLAVLQACDRNSVGWMPRIRNDLAYLKAVLSWQLSELPDPQRKASMNGSILSNRQ